MAPTTHALRSLRVERQKIKQLMKRVDDQLARIDRGELSMHTFASQSPITFGSLVGGNVTMSIDDPCVQDRRVPADVEFATARAIGGGRPLDSSVQAGMNRHFGQDLSRVRVHTDSEADILNFRLRARAFTVGSDIFFRRGEYDPSSLPGQMLIAHELAHVVQQRMNRVPRHGTGMRLRPAHDALEREADEVAWAFAAGQPLFLKALWVAKIHNKVWDSPFGISHFACLGKGRSGIRWATNACAQNNFLTMTRDLEG